MVDAVAAVQNCGMPFWDDIQQTDVNKWCFSGNRIFTERRLDCDRCHPRLHNHVSAGVYGSNAGETNAETIPTKRDTSAGLSPLMYSD